MVVEKFWKSSKFLKIYLVVLVSMYWATISNLEILDTGKILDATIVSTGKIRHFHETIM